MIFPARVTDLKGGKCLTVLSWLQGTNGQTRQEEAHATSESFSSSKASLPK